MKLYVFDVWPDCVYLLSHHDEKSAEAIEHRAAALGLARGEKSEVEVDLDDIPELAPIRAQLDELIARYRIPLNLCLGDETYLNLALEIEPGGKTLLSWQYSGHYFFDAAEPLGADLSFPEWLTR